MKPINIEYTDKKDLINQVNEHTSKFLKEFPNAMKTNFDAEKFAEFVVDGSKPGSVRCHYNRKSFKPNSKQYFCVFEGIRHPKSGEYQSSSDEIEDMLGYVPDSIPVCDYRESAYYESDADKDN